MPLDKKVAVIWASVHGKEKRGGLDEQVKACKDYATRHRIKVDSVFEAIGESAKFDGECFKDAMQYVAKHSYVNTLLITNPDRLTRGVPITMSLLTLLKAKGISVISITDSAEYDIAEKVIEHLRGLLS